MKVIFWMSDGFDTHFTSEHLLKEVIKSLAKAGHIVHIIQMNHSEQNIELPDDLKLANITTSSVSYIVPNKSNFIKRYLSEVKWHFQCKDELIKYKNYDALFLQSTMVGGFAIGIARNILDKNAVITFNVQDIFPYNAMFGGIIKENGFIFKVLATIQRYAYRKADHLITISEDMKKTLVADGIPSGKIEVVYNWSYQDELYKEVDITPISHMFDKEKFNVVYAGNIGVMQNVDILIEAAKLMRNDNSVWFIIIGDGVNKDKLEAKSKEYKLSNISFWPIQPPQFAPAIYYAADVNVIPLASNVYRTALPSKTATCFACQTPVILAIGSESLFGQRVMKYTGCPVISSENAEELVHAIKKIQYGKLMTNTGSFFTEYMNSIVNSQKYVEIITRRK